MDTETEDGVQSCFGSFEVDRAARRLLRDGDVVKMPPRQFDLLLYLVDNPGRLVTKDELLAAVWGDRIVEEGNLTQTMSLLRRALGEGDGDRFIVTAPGRGYRFVAPLRDRSVPAGAFATATAPFRPATTDVAEPSLAGIRPDARVSHTESNARVAQRAAWWPRLALAGRGGGMFGVCVALAAVLAVMKPWVGRRSVSAPRLSIVVLPFRDLSDTAGHGYLADAITDDLTTDFARLPGSVVIARETSDSFRDRSMTAEAIGRKLNVRYLLEGSVRSEPAVLHVNAQLINAEDGSHLWAERFDAPRDNPDAARDRIVAKLGGTLGAELTRLEALRSEHERPNDPDAIDLFFRARSLLEHNDSVQAYETAQSLLERSLRLRPDFVDAQAELGDMLLRKVRSTDDAHYSADFSEANTAIARALTISPAHPKALAAQAHAHFLQNRFGDASHSAKAALQYDPNNIEAQDILVVCSTESGLLADATKALEAIVRLNPASAVAKERLLQLGNLLLLQGRVPEAEDRLHESIAGEPDPQAGQDNLGRSEGAHMLLVAAAWLDGRKAEAHARFQAMERVWPHRSTWREAAMAHKSMAALAGFVAMLGALQAAGMPAYVNEHVDNGIAPSTTPLRDGDFVPTPTTLPGAVTLDTVELVRRLHDKKPTLILDLGRGATVIQGAVWDSSVTEDETSFVNAALKAAPTTDPDRAIVIMSDGTYGSDSYNAALSLTKLGYRNVMWYRGGEEAWSAAHLPGADRRP